MLCFLYNSASKINYSIPYVSSIKCLGICLCFYFHCSRKLIAIVNCLQSLELFNRINLKSLRLRIKCSWLSNKTRVLLENIWTNCSYWFLFKFIFELYKWRKLKMPNIWLVRISEFDSTSTHGKVSMTRHGWYLEQQHGIKHLSCLTRSLLILSTFYGWTLFSLYLFTC